MGIQKLHGTPFAKNFDNSSILNVLKEHLLNLYSYSLLSKMQSENVNQKQRIMYNSSSFFSLFFFKNVIR